MMYDNTQCKIITFVTTYKCSAKCVMCDIWKEKSKDHTLDDSVFDGSIIDVLLKSKMLPETLHTISLTGGEISIVDPKIIGSLVRKTSSAFRNLKKIQINSNAFSVRRTVDLAKAILSNTDVPTVAFGVSLHGVGEVHDRVMGTKGAFSLWQKTYNELMKLREKDERLGVYTNGVLLSQNADNIEALINFVNNNNIDFDLSLPIFSNGYLGSSDHYDGFSLTEGQKNRLLAVFKNGSDLRDGYKFVRHLLEEKNRTVRCIFKETGAFIEPKGDFYACGYIKDSYVGNLLNQDFDILWEKSKDIRASEQLNKYCLLCNANCFPNEGKERGIEIPKSMN